MLWRPALSLPVLSVMFVVGLVGAAQAQDPVSSSTKRIRSVILTGSETCPTADPDEIVVCSRNDEPFRIPKALREQRPSPERQSWTVRAAALDELGRKGAGLPNTCSPIGSGGATGCTAELLRQWRAERAEAKRAAADDAPPN